MSLRLVCSTPDPPASAISDAGPDPRSCDRTAGRIGALADAMVGQAAREPLMADYAHGLAAPLGRRGAAGAAAPSG